MEQRERASRKGFMTPHMCFWSLYLHVSHGKEGGGRDDERKDEHVVLVCRAALRPDCLFPVMSRETAPPQAADPILT